MHVVCESWTEDTQHRPYYFNSMIYTGNPSILTTRTLYKYHIHNRFKRTEFERCNMIALYIYKQTESQDFITAYDENVFS